MKGKCYCRDTWDGLTFLRSPLSDGEHVRREEEGMTNVAGARPPDGRKKPQPMI